jgi:hypothetical protein
LSGNCERWLKINDKLAAKRVETSPHMAKEEAGKELEVKKAMVKRTKEMSQR